MPSTFFGLEIARRGLLSSRTAMDVTAHNLANASTKGYTRQDPVFTATDPYTMPGAWQKLLPGQMGSGVEVSQIRRVRDSILDQQVRSALGEDGFWQARQDALQRVEAVFPEPSDVGLGDVIGRFFNAWHELNNSPTDPGLKAAVKELGQELALNFRHTYTQLKDIKDSLQQSIDLKVNQINAIARELAGLNREIARIVASGNQPNDLLDRRDLLLDELNGLVPVQVVVNKDETINVSLKYYDGNTEKQQSLVVYDGSYYQLKTSINNDELSLNVLDQYGSPVMDGSNPVTIPWTAGSESFKLSGSLAGVENARRRVQDYMDQLDQLAYGLAAYVNNLHHDKYDSDGKLITTGNDKGVDFFALNAPTYDPGNNTDDNSLNDSIDYKTYLQFSTDKGSEYVNYVKGYAGKIDLSDKIKSDVNNVNGTQALNIAGLRTELTMPDTAGKLTATFEAFYRGLVAGIGADAQGADHQVGTTRAVLQQLENLRQSVSGVSLDEELTRLIQFQYAFQASARLVTVLDDMLNTLINRMAI
ncbi:flagellar hook-associated protein FlgK [Desulfofundulus thermocisternus]|uniref:flagellar hook-associated protein FlgK n=1 Tax=Desulfofundulus thermocisternus TaxID=42471 RepID=UPI00217D1DC0|nr:flagellar hook-associated protein FlgK [Desulfofundulus thermocisternus]MCS5696630.1 flagellar hook-associated protein FlgK [Desulfofundulus thermocisternus]